ncbi:MAG TPA: TetR/AcrR family transcriptional regulator [Kofleriaceae bacterium]|nr:TetR/AcrR family transcriptional regulator [Kofleriaceae bacterium]
MGRPKEHDAATRAELLAAAERVVEAEGQQAFSLRRIAAEAGTTTRAVYSVFGSRDGLLVALGTRAFELLGAGVAAVAVTDDPAADLVESGLVFRTFALEHPGLFALAVQWTQTSPDVIEAFRPARIEAGAALRTRLHRAAVAGVLGAFTIDDAFSAFHSLCEGLAAIELRGLVPRTDAPRLWRAALSALVAGFAMPAPVRHARKRRRS